jgi:hypothetical protein
MARRFAVFLVCAFLCVHACGCALWSREREVEEVERTGRGVLLFPTEREERAGYR